MSQTTITPGPGRAVNLTTHGSVVANAGPSTVT